MTLLLDTNAYSELRRGHLGVADAVRSSEKVLLSAIVVGELLHGFRRGSRYDKNRRELADFLDSFYVGFLPVTMTTADRFARIASSLRQKGTPIPSNDLWIAAHALETGADLLSFDEHFDRVEGLVRLWPS